MRWQLLNLYSLLNVLNAANLARNGPQNLYGKLRIFLDLFKVHRAKGCRLGMCLLAYALSATAILFSISIDSFKYSIELPLRFLAKDFPLRDSREITSFSSPIITTLNVGFLAFNFF